MTSYWPAKLPAKRCLRYVPVVWRLWASRTRIRSAALGVCLTLALVALATLVRWALGSLIDQGMPYVIYLAAVAASTRWLGVISGALATLVSAIFGTYFFASPGGSFHVDDPRDVISAVTFLLASAVIIAVIKAERSAREKSEQHERALMESQAHRQRLATELEEARRLESLGRLAGGVAHDFNNLLTVVAGSCELLKQQMPHEELLEGIELAARRGSGLTKQLLGIAGRQPMALQSMSPNLAVEEAVKLGRTLLPEDIMVRTSLHPDPWMFQADATQIQQVLLNLLTNARDAMPSGGVILIETDNVTLDGRFNRRHPEVTPGEYVLIRIADEGAGMSSEIQRRIFEPFFTTKDGRGTGLGLAVVYGVVKQLGGHISVVSAQGQGTRIEVYWPRSRPDGPITAEPEPVQPGSTPLRILLVEDEALVRKTTAEMLRRLGHTVIEANDGAEALVAARDEGPLDVLLTDVVMPWMNGPELAGRLRKIRPDIGVVYMSGYADNVVLQKGLLNTGATLARKPFTSAQLDAALRRAGAARSRVPQRRYP